LSYRPESRYPGHSYSHSKKIKSEIPPACPAGRPAPFEKGGGQEEILSVPFEKEGENSLHL